MIEHTCGNSLNLVEPDGLELASWLVKQNTITPSPNESTVLKQIASLLEQSGFTCELNFYDKDMSGRANLCARLHPNFHGPALCLGGHIDTVPLGTDVWDHDPFMGEVIDGRLFGRGSCDMKAGVGAILSVAVKMAPFVRDRDFVIHLYGGEERSCEGSFAMVQQEKFLKNIAAAIIAEPTCCKPLLGHRGCIWLKLSTKGKTAHACMPAKGDNALVKLLKSVEGILDFKFNLSHPVLGESTFVISTLHSGLNTNSVPDSAVMTIDMRVVPGQSFESIVRKIQSIIGSQVKIEVLQNLVPLWTEPDNDFVKMIYECYSSISDSRIFPGAVQFATDGAALRSKNAQMPIVIWGPGDTSLAHQLNESCSCKDIALMEKMYEKVVRSFYGI